jgi:hypothetical protein
MVKLPRPLFALAAVVAAGWAALPQGVKTIAMDWVVLPREYGDLPSVRTRFDSLISDRLRAQGFAIVPPQVGESIWLRLRDSIGGYYDTYTGNLNPAKFEQVRTAALTELKTKYHVDAWLHPFIRAVLARFNGGKVKWDGVEEQSGARGGLGGFLFGTKEGTVPALSLIVSVEDMTGTDLYTGVGGIRLVVRLDGDRFVRLPRDSLFIDGSRNAAAIHLALDSLPPSLAAKQRP